MSTNTTSVWRKKLKELEIVVVIPTYNNGKTLAAVIEEVCRYADDIIVVNDGSTDDTTNILEQYPAIRTITHPVNKGKGTALKHGLSQAKKRVSAMPSPSIRTDSISLPIFPVLSKPLKRARHAAGRRPKLSLRQYAGQEYLCQ